MLLTILVFLAALVALALLIRSTVFLVKYTQEWIGNARPEVFPRPTRCPRCHQRLGRFERMRTFAEVLFGGWSCPGCGSEFDQLDNIRLARAWNAHLRDAKKRLRTEGHHRSMEDDRTPVERLIDE